MLRHAQVGEGSAADTGDADHIDVEDAVPFLVIVAGDVSGGADPGVVDDDVDAAERVDHGGDGAVHGIRVGDVALHREKARVVDGNGAVQNRHPGAALLQQRRRGGADAAGTPGHDCRQAIEVLHGTLLI